MTTPPVAVETLRALSAECAELGRRGAERIGGTVQLMEVCGTHTHAIARCGVRQLLGEAVRLVSGPGCPVCVTSAGQIDLCLQIAQREDTILATFGDMVRVPGSETSLAEARARGARVKVLYSPMECLPLAAENPDSFVVMAGVGFETTAPSIAVMVREARKAGLSNLLVFSAHKLVPPAMCALLEAEDVRLHGFICPGHASVVIGSDAYQDIVERYQVPCVVTGFEPTDILLGVRALLQQVADGEARAENAYGRAVRAAGNPRAVEAIYSVFEVADASWRGIGVLPNSGLRLRPEWSDFDVMKRFGLSEPEAREHPACHCGEVLQGKLLPPECPAFGKACTPTRPLGPCMVSSEGACAAEYRYRAA